MTLTHVSANGSSIALDTTGTGPLVLCSPAMGDTIASYQPLRDRLVAAGFRVALADLRGHGESALFDSYGDEQTAADLVAIIEHLGSAPALVVGTSMSAAAAVIAAGNRPDLVNGLVLMAPFVRNGAGAIGRLALRVALLRPWGPGIWRSYAARLWPALPTARERSAKLTRLLTRPGRWRAFTATTRTDHAVAAPWLGGRLTLPVLVVMGTADPDWKDPEAEATWVASQFPGARVELVAGAGHAPMLEAPDDVASVIIPFATATAHA